MADPNRLLVDKLLLHHAVTPTWEEKSRAELAQWFSDLGFSRGYGGNPANWSGLINPYTGQRSYAMAHIAGQRVDHRTPDATDAERAAGFRIVELVADIWGVITWNAANWEVNRSCIGLENLGDFRNYPLRDGDMRVIADFWRGRDQELGGATAVLGHHEVAQIVTQCPARIMEARDTIVHYINNPPAAPVPEPTPAPVEAPAPAENPYTRFSQPMELVANKQPTSVYDTAHGTWAELKGAVVKQLNQGDPFVAVGKYKHPLGGVYFMTAFSFGDADKTGTPAHPYGINTVDLSPKPQPVVEAQPVPAPVATPAPAPVEEAVTIPVTVVPPAPDKWKDSFVTWGEGEYIATQSLAVKDLEGRHNDLQLIRGQTVKVAGQFIKDGHTYYRTRVSLATNKWYGIPVKANDQDTLTEDDNIFGDFLAEDIAANADTIKEKTIKVVASIDGILHRKLHK